MAGRRTWVGLMLLGGLGLGCGADVVVLEEGGAGGGSNDIGGVSGRENPGIVAPPPPCVPCRGGDCGWCAHEGGDSAYRCTENTAPRSDQRCEATGNLFVDDATGAHYVCWRCFD
ncbi:MAG: hypothetical protein AAGN82_06175 [Myxococcota bacterium]